MKLIFNNVVRTQSGTGIWQDINNIKYYISFQTLFNWDIDEESAMSEFEIILDETKPLAVGDGTFKFINPPNIKMINIDKKIIEKVRERKKQEKKKHEENLEAQIFIDDEEEEIEKNIGVKIEWETIYRDLQSYEIVEAPNRKMNKIDKLVQKSIKLTKRKFFNIPKNKSNISYILLKSLSTDNVDAWLKGDIETIKIKKPSMPKIPTKLKGDAESIMAWLKTKPVGLFITKTNEDLYLRDKITISIMLEDSLAIGKTKFNKIANSYRESLTLKKETGINPFVMAWPFIKGKTNTGAAIHAPLAHRDIKIKESLDTYEITLGQTFLVNTYPILKNYESTNHQVNEIVPEHNSLKSLLQEFFKHGIKIGRPTSDVFEDYKDVNDWETNKWPGNNFELSNETILRMKPSDEYIYYDLRSILKEGEEFSIPTKTKRFLMDQREYSTKSEYIYDIDLSKAIAVDTALNESTVIYGPPGTGKSATITTFIGKIIESGKNSLFIAEKATAIDVIEKNLKKIKLDDFVFNMNNNSKLDFVSKFNKLVEIIGNLKYEKYINIDGIDFAQKWLEENKERHHIINKVTKDYKVPFGDLSILLKVKEISKKNIFEVWELFRNKPVYEDAVVDISKQKNKVDEQEEKIKKLKDEKRVLLNDALTNINNNRYVKIIFETEKDIERIAIVTTIKEIGLIVSNSTFKGKFSGWTKSSTQALKEIRKIAKEFMLKSVETNMKVLVKENELRSEKNMLSEYNEIITKYESFPFEELLKYEKLLNSFNEETIKYIDDNWMSLKEFKEDAWIEHNLQKEKHIETIRNATVNNYSVRMKEFLEEENNEEKLTRLKAFINNKLNRKSQSIQMLFARPGAWELLIKIFPTIMMNPDFVSKIFPPKKDIFDYAIFDEASQIRLHRAMPAIHRAERLLVAGDDKQLGPTDLFTNLERDEDDEFDINEDTSLNNSTLLNFAKDKYKGVQLNTHYRSKSKDLIKFSNENFYGNEITISDSPNPSIDGKAPIWVEEIGGKWTSDRTNVEEAERAVELIKYYKGLKLSVGVITFNDPQKNLINNLCANDDELKTFVESNSYFLKSIKDVQGDEMDVIIFSIAYGQYKDRQPNTYVKMFGQFSKEKINVAITRSKMRIHVLKSLPSSQVDADNDDKRIFKKWLEFIEEYTSEKFDPSINAGTPVNDFEEDYIQELKDFLNKERYSAYSNYKTGGKEIDIVLYDKFDEKFIGAIELDGAKWHSSQEAVLKDYERQMFLENMGWKFVRTGFHNFYKNRRKCVEEHFKQLLEMNQENI